jgi:tetratricopeptide (TPR) repeat protein
MILHLLENNLWLRPIYFANTVSRSGQLGLEDYFQFEGKAFRIMPLRRSAGPFGYVDPEVHSNRLEQFQFNQWNSPGVYFDENVRRMLGNYRYGFTQLADAYMDRGDLDSAAKWLRHGEDMIPFRTVENDWTVAALYAYRYMRVGENDRAVNLSDHISERLKHELRYDMRDLDRAEIRLEQVEEDIRRARARAQTDRARSLQRDQQRFSRHRENAIQDVSFNVSRLSILQNIYFETGQTEKAEEMAIEISMMTGGRLPMPETIEESREQIERFGLGI